MTTPTDTPLDACPHCGAERIPMPRFDDGRIQFYCGSGESWQSAGCRSTARINGLEAEVERLRNELSDWDYGTRAKREQERAEKAEAEVKRLKEYYSRFILVSPIEAGRIEKMEDEVKEIRAALGDDGRRTHKELLELATKASQWREWKEKYIDLRNAHIAEGQDPAGTIWEHADKLQKKLKEAEAGIERLKASVQHYQDQALHFQHAQ